MSFPRIQPAAVESYIEEQVRHIHSHIRDYDGDLTPEAVHKARVATRRLKVGIDLVQPVIERGPFRKLDNAARKLRKRLGRVREFDVMLNQLAQLATREPIFGALRDSLGEDRAAEMRKSSVNAMRTIDKQIQISKEATNELMLIRPAIVALVREAVLSDFDTFRVAADTATASANNPTGLHALRIAAKRFRYQLEVAHAVGFSFARDAAGQFKQMQDALGAWHDEVVLARAIAKYAGRGSRFEDQSGDAKRLIALCNDRMGRAKSAHLHFSSAWKRTHRVLTDAIRQVAEAPFNKPTTGRGRSKKP